MSLVVFAFPGNESLARRLSSAADTEEGIATIRHFPDGESFVQVQSAVTGKRVVVVATLDRPDDKIMALYYLCKKLKDDGAEMITLVAPYLAYMRQDKSFHGGEVITSVYFASLLSSMVDRLITVDPHLHRHHHLSEIFTIPCITLHAGSFISNWIKDHVANPVLIGPDIESKQWVSQVAANIHAPFIILKKERLGDQTVKVSVPHVEQYRTFSPVLLDDIISTGRTMIETLKHLSDAKLKPSICIGVHALFAGDAYDQLTHAGASAVVTCNTIPHASNRIDLSELIIQSMANLF